MNLFKKNMQATDNHVVSVQKFVRNRNTGFLQKIKALFSADSEQALEKQSIEHRSIGYSEITEFLSKKKLATDDHCFGFYAQVMDKKSFEGIKEGAFRSRKVLYTPRERAHAFIWGKQEYLLDIPAQCSKQTIRIIDECVQELDKEREYKRQQIHSLPQLCRHYELSVQEIETLCYLLYDCPESMEQYSHEKYTVMSMARHLCKERRHVLRLSITEYANLLRQAILLYSHNNIFEIILWLNAISRCRQVVFLLTPLQQEEKLVLLGLFNISRKTMVSITQGRTVDKTLLKLLREKTPTTVKVLQETIIIAAVTGIIMSQMGEQRCYDPSPILYTISADRYMLSENPVFSLLQIFRTIGATYPSLCSHSTELFSYVLSYLDVPSCGAEEFHYINTILYTSTRIVSCMPGETPSVLYFSIIQKLVTLPLEMVAFYGINPHEFFEQDKGVYFSLFPLLAYMQYNRVHDVREQTVLIMKYIPLEMYKHSEKPYFDIQHFYNIIVEQCPLLVSASIKELEMIFAMHLDSTPFSPSDPYAMFVYTQEVLIAVEKTQKIQTFKVYDRQDSIIKIASLPLETIRYVSRFPELFFSPILEGFDSVRMGTVISYACARSKRNIALLFSVLLEFVSPLAIFEEHSQHEAISKETLCAKVITLVEQMNEVLFCRTGYTEADLRLVLSTLQPLYYKYPFPVDAHIRLVSHTSAVLEAHAFDPTCSLEELSKKNKSILKKCRKDHHTE